MIYWDTKFLQPAKRASCLIKGKEFLEYLKDHLASWYLLIFYCKTLSFCVFVFQKSHSLFLEILKSLIGASKFSFFLLIFYLLKVTNAFIPKWKYKYYYNLNEALKKKFTVSIFYGLLLYVRFLIMIYSNCRLYSRIFLGTMAYSYTQHIRLLPITTINHVWKLLESCVPWYLMCWDYHQQIFPLGLTRKACL